MPKIETNNATRRSPPKQPSVPPDPNEIDAMMLMTPTRSPLARKRRNHRSMNSLHIPILAIFLLLWISLVVFSYSSLNQRRQIANNNIIESLQVLRQRKFPNKRLDQPHVANLSIPVSNDEHGISGSEDGKSGVDEDYSDIVHIIHSRFMQLQPHLIDLGMARLKLFEELFLRSMEQQSSSNFIVCIRTDPDLDLRIKTRLIRILENSSLRYLLIAGNQNPPFQYHDLIALLTTTTTTTTTSEDYQKTIWSGSWKEAQSYLLGKSNNSGRVLETRLDADDGLHTLFVESIQQIADNSFDFQESTWKVWCAGRHLEWQYEIAWSENKLDVQYGSLVTLKLRGCITAGLTTGFSRRSATQTLTFPTKKHQSMHAIVPSCKKEKYNCLSYLPLTPSALRARTPTSAGMLNILWSNKTEIGSKPHTTYTKGASKQQSIQDQLWMATETLFGFSKEVALDLHNYLERNMIAIAKDNLKGQCTDGHSCKNSSQELLRAIVESSK